MDDAPSIRKSTKGFGKNQKFILSLLYISPQPIKKFISVKETIQNLQDRGLIQLKENQVFLTELGQATYEFWQDENGDGKSGLSSSSSMQKRQESAKLIQIKQAKLERSNQFLELYKQGLSYQAIGNQYSLTRERVRQILKDNPAFQEYIKSRKSEI